MSSSCPRLMLSTAGIIGKRMVRMVRHFMLMFSSVLQISQAAPCLSAGP